MKVCRITIDPETKERHLVPIQGEKGIIESIQAFQQKAKLKRTEYPETVYALVPEGIKYVTLIEETRIIAVEVDEKDLDKAITPEFIEVLDAQNQPVAIRNTAHTGTEKGKKAAAGSKFNVLNKTLSEETEEETEAVNA